MASSYCNQPSRRILELCKATAELIQELDALHLSNDTVRRRLDGIANDIKTQLVRILQNKRKLGRCHPQSPTG